MSRWSQQNHWILSRPALSKSCFLEKLLLNWRWRWNSTSFVRFMALSIPRATGRLVQTTIHPQNWFSKNCQCTFYCLVFPGSPWPKSCRHSVWKCRHSVPSHPLLIVFHTSRCHHTTTQCRYQLKSFGSCLESSKTLLSWSRTEQTL